MSVTCSKMYHSVSIIKEGNLYTSLVFLSDVFLSKKS